ncbi:UBA/THIF-type NAD/FAD binding protein [Shewanella halifaxensis HAW-EB4]|uniref:UBA/THIF-type NAD/FAD binding protein n=1 Tax=Shewanella halifaxensis (strain HAW-EB4) TaxID=458817 RepID=B0TRP9_SHEHH|nr:HesA/MoeB/ThiF family protein [Shewanella halifaxensis]ABZ76467.1 UBA/THIF-type NAD/FAD binding protein [Shewanella halifaxensis HAW-EB4]
MFKGAINRSSDEISLSLSDSDFLHYSRQVLLPEVGEAGQILLANAHVAVIGIGGLGNVAAQYLAAAGVGHITLVDGDDVEVSNLPRQLLFTVSDIGGNKAQVAQKKLSHAYTQVKLAAVTDYLTKDNIQQALSIQALGIQEMGIEAGQYDLLLDCSDNFETRQLVNRFAISNQLPLVSASAAHFQGQLLNIDQRHSPQSGCYHCLFPADMQVGQSCQTVGVLGPMVGTLASMQALMALQQLLGHRDTVGKLFRFDGKQFSWREARLPRSKDCLVCRADSNNNNGNGNDCEPEYRS